MGEVHTRACALLYSNVYISVSTFYFPSLSPSLNLPTSQIPLFLTEIKPSLLVTPLMKLHTLDGGQPWPSAQMLIVRITNNPYHYHSNLYLFLSLPLLFYLFSLDTSLRFYFPLYSILSTFSIAEL